jgi:hypothetical protein
MSSLKNNSEILALTTEKEIGSLPKDNHVQYCYFIYKYTVLNVKEEEKKNPPKKY